MNTRIYRVNSFSHYYNFVFINIDTVNQSINQAAVLFYQKSIFVRDIIWKYNLVLFYIFRDFV